MNITVLNIMCVVTLTYPVAGSPRQFVLTRPLLRLTFSPLLRSIGFELCFQVYIYVKYMFTKKKKKYMSQTKPSYQTKINKLES